MTFRDIEPYLLGFYQVHDLNDNVLDFDEIQFIKCFFSGLVF